MSKARDLIHEVVRLELAPLLKDRGFKKNGMNFTRRRGSVVHYLNIQLSSWNQGSQGSFYVNAGLMFDEIFRHYCQEPPAIPKYDDCNFMVRLERIDSNLPPQFSIDEKTDLKILAKGLANIVERAYVKPTESFTALRDLGGTGWVETVPWGFPALFHFLTGNKDEARRLVQLEAETFANRGVTFDSVARGLSLSFA